MSVYNTGFIPGEMLGASGCPDFAAQATRRQIERREERREAAARLARFAAELWSYPRGLQLNIIDIEDAEELWRAWLTPMAFTNHHRGGVVDGARTSSPAPVPEPGRDQLAFALRLWRWAGCPRIGGTPHGWAFVALWLSAVRLTGEDGGLTNQDAWAEVQDFYLRVVSRQIEIEIEEIQTGAIYDPGSSEYRALVDKAYEVAWIYTALCLDRGGLVLTGEMVHPIPSDRSVTLLKRLYRDRGKLCRNCGRVTTNHRPDCFVGLKDSAENSRSTWRNGGAR